MRPSSDGWLYTGDIVRIDEKGYLHIVGRAKDIILRGGQNIYPSEIERYLENPSQDRGSRRGGCALAGRR